MSKEKAFTPEQEAEIEKIAEATGHPRALVEDAVRAKMPAPVHGKVVDADEDDATKEALADQPGPAQYAPKRVVQGTSRKDTEKALKGRKQEPLAE